MKQPVLHDLARARTRFELKDRGPAHLQSTGQRRLELAELLFAAEVVGQALRSRPMTGCRDGSGQRQKRTP